MIDVSVPLEGQAYRYPLGFVFGTTATDTRWSLTVPLSLLDVAFRPPTATLPCYEDALYAVVGASAASGLSLDQLPADRTHFCIGTPIDPEHRTCLIDMLARFAVATNAKSDLLGVFA